MSEIEKIKEAALKILDYQDRTVAELTDKLVKKGFPEELVGGVVAEFQDSGLVDDSRYARLYIQSKMNAGKGRIWIKQKLRQKGIDRQTADDAFEEVSEDVDERILCIQKAISLCGLSESFFVEPDGYIYPVREDDMEEINYFSRKIPEGENDRNVIYKTKQKARDSLTRRLISAGFPSGMVFEAVKKIDEL